MSELPNSPEYDNPEFSIESARPEDAAEIVTMKNQVWLDTYPNPEAGVSEDDIRLRIEGNDGELVPEMTKRWEQIIAKTGDTQAVFVARKQGKIVGLVAPGLIKGQRRLGALYVLPEAQRQGLGSKLINKAIEWHGRQEDIFLHVVAYNQNAIDFYEKNGFEKTDKTIEDPLMPEIEMVLPALSN